MNVKKLFRTSKAPGIDPFPEQPPTSMGPPSVKGMDRLIPAHEPKRRNHHAQGSVTPFPIDVGRSNEYSTAQAGHVAASAPAPASRSRGERNPTPKLADLRQMEEDASSAAFRREGNNATGYPTPPSRSRAGTGASNPATADGWGSAPPQQQSFSSPQPNGPGANYNASYNGQQQQQQQPSPVAQPGFYLPPGAGPPSPKFSPATPPRIGHISQPSLANPLPPSVTASYGAAEHDGYASGRSRGYSSASQSGRGSDHEGSVHHMGASPLPSLLPKPASQVASGRSPLANSYSEPPPGSMAFPTPQKYSHRKSALTATASAPAERATVSREAPMDKEKEKEREKAEKHKSDKGDKKKFWSSWGDRKSKAKETEKELPRPSVDGSTRPSFDEWREGDVSNNGHSSVGHGLEDPSRPRAAGHGQDVAPPQAKATAPGSGREPNETYDVCTAIRVLCANVNGDSTFHTVLEVCDRVNRAQHSDSVSKEAARGIRKVFKGGRDEERRMAARVWWIAMNNITTKGFHHYASNRKFTGTLETLLILNPVKPQVLPDTYHTIMKVLSDLTFRYGRQRASEGLLDLWKKVKNQNDPEYGTPLPDDWLRRAQIPPPLPPSNGTLPSPAQSMPLPVSRPPSAPSSRISRGVATTLGSVPLTYGGPGYVHLPDHGDDMRRLVEQSSAGMESARILQEAVVYTRPEELDEREFVRESYQECVRAQESLHSQLGWAQSEAKRSLEVADSIERKEQTRLTTMEESALKILLEALDALGGAIKQFDELEEMAAEEADRRAALERSKKDTRMDRRQQMDMLSAPGEGQASSSRSPSPSRAMQLGGGSSASRSPDFSTARAAESYSNESYSGHLVAPAGNVDQRSRSPSPDRRSHQLPNPPRIGSPPRTASPLGRSRVPGPRPLPNPFRKVNSSQSLGGIADAPAPQGGRGGGSSSNEGPSVGSTADGENYADDDAPPARPSRKALGKRRAEPKDDDGFDPDDMFGIKRPSSPSDESTNGDDYAAKPIVYAYDAYQERLKELHAKQKLPENGHEVMRLPPPQTA